jgi:hypothetical protein
MRSLKLVALAGGALALFSFNAVEASGRPDDCKKFLTGQWAGKGDFDAFGTIMKVDNRYSYNKDGTFETVNRYLGEGNVWQEQRIRGTWTVAPGQRGSECLVTMNGQYESAGTSSTSTFQIIDEDTFRSLGFDMRRVRD